MTSHKTYFDPHGYFFVCLPDSVYRRKLARCSDQFCDEEGNELIPQHGPSSSHKLLSGVLTCHLICITPVHIGSGSYRYDLNVPGNVVADIVRNPQGKPVIPGSSLKGSFRAIAEAASMSCLSLKQDIYQEDFQKLPWETGYRRHTRPRNTYWASNIQQPLVDRDNQLQAHKQKHRQVAVKLHTAHSLDQCTINAHKPEQSQLCPCCSVFGMLGFKGRLAFTDAHIIDPYPTLTPVTIPARNSPQPHRLSDKATWTGDPTNRLNIGGMDVRGSGGNLTLEVLKPLGRKFYPNWDPHGHFQSVQNGQQLNSIFYNKMQQDHGRGSHVPSLYNHAAFTDGEPHDAIPINTVLEFRLHFQSLLLWELGLVVLAMGAKSEWLPKLGGAKAYGLGSVRVEYQRLDLVADIITGPQVLCAEGAAQKINECLSTFLGHQSCHQEGVADLRAGFAINLNAQNLHIADNINPLTR